MASQSIDASRMWEIPAATYRLQFGPDFGFRDAREIVPYLHDLGVSHVYASPILKARRGSTHGYDITDHNALNDELGEERDFDEFVAALHGHGMGLILDIVPNHMGIGRSDNEWWLDVLEWGQASPYAQYFDIDWQPEKRELRGKVLLPFLGDHYGKVLEAGELELRFDHESGMFSVWYFDHRFPIAPHLYSRILAVGLEEARAADPSGVAALESLIVEFRALRSARSAAGGRLAARAAADGLRRQLVEAGERDGRTADHVRRCIAHFNGTPGDARTFMSLHRLLELQHYRLAYWRVAADEINYRRFFDINELAALRMESDELFETVHRQILRWIGEGKVQGLRVDHVDGLYNPRAYCEAVCNSAESVRPKEAGDAGAFYLLVEKILAEHERLPRDWRVAGTTGYEFANQVNGVFVDPAGKHAMSRVYRRFTGEAGGYGDVLRKSKLQILNTALSGELMVLARELDRISESNWRSRDYTLDGLKEALRQVVAAFGIYRTYIEARRVNPDDRREILSAVTAARAHASDLDPGLFDFLYEVLTTDLVKRPRSGYRRGQVNRFAAKFQQFTAPVMAKSMEDTAFYRFNRLVSLNEVGGDPGLFGASVDEFHEANRERRESFPHSMLATTTHDTKRGEDVRARIDILSEIPEEWERHVNAWARINRSRKSVLDGRPAPSANDEYLLYQTLVGTWPIEDAATPPEPPPDLDTFRERIQAYMVKAVREGKRQSSWANPNLAYEQALTDFVSGVLDTSNANPFLESFRPFQASISRLGMLNGISQTALKLLAPGVPDIYQGTETWCLSLVDPDNRRPVAFDEQAAALNEVGGGLRCRPSNVPDPARSLLDTWRDGRIKLRVISTILRFRRENPRLFREGGYVAATGSGEYGGNVCAFARRFEGKSAIVVVPRLVAGLLGSRSGPPVGEATWRDTRITLDWDGQDGELVDLLTGRRHGISNQGGELSLAVASVLRDFPVAVLEAV